MRSTILSILLIITALLAALGSAFWSRTNYMVGAGLAALALILSLIISVTIVPRLAQRARLEFFDWKPLAQITVPGWLYLAVTGIVGLAAVNTANNLLYLIFSIFIALLFAANLIARMSLRDLVVKLRLPEHIFTNEPTLLSVTLENQKKRLPSFSVTVEANTTSDQGHLDEGASTQTPSDGPMVLAYFPFIPRHTSLRLHTRQTFTHRGCYRFYGFTLITRFPTGFFRRSREVEAEGELVVYPKPQPISDFFHLLPINDGQFESRLKGVTGADLYGIRPYESSDVMRRVDWKATAKLSRLMVKDYTREDEWRINLVFDTSQVMNPDFDFNDKFERAVTLAASVASHFVAEGAELQLVTPEGTLPYGAGRDHLYQVLRRLAVLRPLINEEKMGKSQTAWWLFDEIPVLARDRHYKIVITSAERGSIPASLWRTAHVVYLRDI